MSSGGARVRSGPVRDPMAVRRGRTPDRSGIVRLPITGREGDLPAWPLPGRPTKFELQRWAVEWAKPQAIMWERLGWELQVALYIRTIKRMLEPKAPAGLNTQRLQQENNLALTTAGLKFNQWVIEEGAPEAAPAPRRSTGVSAKDRLSLITGGQRARAS